MTPNKQRELPVVNRLWGGDVRFIFDPDTIVKRKTTPVTTLSIEDRRNPDHRVVVTERQHFPFIFADSVGIYFRI